ncbi:MAG: hypothetical protein AAFV33_28815, partial [Chloroflexota bacterium]
MCLAGGYLVSRALGLRLFGLSVALFLALWLLMTMFYRPLMPNRTKRASLPVFVILIAQVAF